MTKLKRKILSGASKSRVRTWLKILKTSNLSSGTYIVKLISDKGSATNKIVKL